MLSAHVTPATAGAISSFPAEGAPSVAEAPPARDRVERVDMGLEGVLDTAHLNSECSGLICIVLIKLVTFFVHIEKVI